jgi:hypothetical protein
MKRFIVLSFAFLAFGFYELSGGSDFDPVAAREIAIAARLEKSGDPKTTKLASETASQPKKNPVVRDEPVVTRASLNLTSIEEVLTKPEAPAEAAKPPAAENPLTQSLTEKPSVVLPSLVFAGTTSQASSDAVRPPRDIRSVAGVSVNMRAGPGTNHNVVTQLDRDTQVEVLQDNGTGWVQLRPVLGGPTGWVADFLLTGS